MEKSIAVKLVAVIAVLVIAVAGTFIFLNNGGGSNNDSGTTDDYLTEKSGTATVQNIDTKLHVFGNANNDLYLNNEDIEFIQNIVDGNTKWKSTENPFADTNADGSITSEDVKLLKEIIAGHDATMFYVDSLLDTHSITYPLKGNICISQQIDYEMLKVCNRTDMITAYSDMTVNEDSFPGSSDWKNVGTYPYDYERTVAAGVNITFGQDYNYDDTFDRLVKEGQSSYKLDSIKLFEGRYMNNVDSISCIITLGVLMNSTNETSYKNYLSYIDGVNKIIDDATSSITTTKSYALIVTHATSSPSEIGIDNETTAVMNYSDIDMVETLEMIPSYPVGPECYMRGKTIEDIMKYNPDVIFIEESRGSSTHDDYQKNVLEIADWFRSAGYTGQIIGIHWSVCGSSSFIAALPVLTDFIYGNDLEGKDSSWKELVNYYNTFLGMGFDVDGLKKSIYAPFVVE